jgi:hypothetical protein
MHAEPPDYRDYILPILHTDFRETLRQDIQTQEVAYFGAGVRRYGVR